MTGNRDCYITHGWRDDRHVTYLGEAEPGYAWIRDENGKRVVPIDQLVFKDKDSCDDLL